ncbi:MAG: nitrate/nitrite transporter NrtS [Acidimicrobiia bacterium]
MSTRGERDLSWSGPVEAAGLILRGVTFRTASKIAVIVGSLLTAVNQGSVIVAGHATTPTWIRTVANYVIPYTVASVGYLTPFRRGS